MLIFSRLKRDVKNIITMFKEYLRNDPVKNCSLFKEKGCSHVDGFLCDFPNCSMYKEYEYFKELQRYVDALEEGRAVYNKINYEKYLELLNKYENNENK